MKRKRQKRSKPLALVILVLLLIVSSVTTGYLVSENFKLLSSIDTSLDTDLDVSPTPNKQEQTPTPAPEKKPKVFAVSNKYKPDAFNFKFEIKNNEGKPFPVGDNSFPPSSEYSKLKGITTFRGNNFRSAPSYGVSNVNEEKLSLAWTVPIGFIDSWTGVGWTGQPAIVCWPDDLKSAMNINVSKKNKSNLTEVIYATMDGKIYFLDLEDGKPTRNPIDIGYPIKGSVSIDPRGYPILYVGQGIDTNGPKTGDIGYRMFSLIDQKQTYFINGIDTFAYRKWGAFDSSPLINSKNDSMILPGENGLLYFVKLNSSFNASSKSLQMKPDVFKMKFKTSKSSTFGSENSIAVYANYGFFTDNDGMMYCIDLNNMSPVWVRPVTDDTDSTTLIEETKDGELFLYTGCGVDIQGTTGNAVIRKINALTAETVWEKQYPAAYNKDVSGGVMSTGVIGKNSLSDLVFYNVAKTKDSPNSFGGKLIAFDKNTGKEIWTNNMKNYAWSSPVDVYTKDGKGYLIQCTSDGLMHLIDGKSGKILNSLNLGSNIEGSPAVFDDTIVVGTRGQTIVGVKIK